MVAHHVHDAIEQVTQLQDLILEKRRFRGYSGTARLLSGFVALAGTLVLSSPSVPARPLPHLAGWCLVLLASLLLNYGALLYWFLFDPQVRRNPRMIRPAFDALPALGVGALLSLGLVLQGQFALLFGVWFCHLGLAQLAYRQSLPRGIYAAGLFYVACGAWALLSPSISFYRPLPAGLVFFLGEIAGGLALIADRHPPRGPAPPDTPSTPDTKPEEP